MKTLALAFALLAASSVAAEQSAGLDPLISLVENAATPSLDASLPRTAIDAGPEAIPYLKHVLTAGTPEKVSIASAALMYIGGDEAIAALRDEYDRTKSLVAKNVLCIALAARGTREDRDFLMRSLQGKHIGDEWEPIVAAAFSLGVLHAKDALESLRTTAGDGKDGSAASDAASQAVRWIEHGPWKVQLPDQPDESDRIVAAALANGIPWPIDENTWVAARDKSAWHLDHDVWTMHSRDDAGASPMIGHSVHVNPAGDRAILSMGRLLGPLNGSGYDFVLRKVGGVWKVEAVIFAWIS